MKLSQYMPQVPQMAQQMADLNKQISLLDVMKDMCRYKNMRMNASNYKITEGRVPVEEGQLSLFVA